MTPEIREFMEWAKAMVEHPFDLMPLAFIVAIFVLIIWQAIKTYRGLINVAGYVNGTEDWLISEKPKNDDRVGFDPYAETDEPAYTIGDDGELVEIDRG